MDRNIRIAKELVRIARTLVASNDDDIKAFFNEVNDAVSKLNNVKSTELEIRRMGSYPVAFIKIMFSAEEEQKIFLKISTNTDSIFLNMQNTNNESNNDVIKETRTSFQKTGDIKTDSGNISEYVNNFIQSKQPKDTIDNRNKAYVKEYSDGFIAKISKLDCVESAELKGGKLYSYQHNCFVCHINIKFKNNIIGEMSLNFDQDPNANMSFRAFGVMPTGASIEILYLDKEQEFVSPNCGDDDLLDAIKTGYEEALKNKEESPVDLVEFNKITRFFVSKDYDVERDFDDPTVAKLIINDGMMTVTSRRPDPEKPEYEYTASKGNEKNTFNTSQETINYLEKKLNA